MTTIHTTGRISDTIKLVNCHGEELQISFDFLPSLGMLQKYRQLQLDLAQAAKQPEAEKAERVGQLVLELFQTIFGAENTERMVTFYDGQFEFMAVDFIPYLQNTIVPRCREAAKNARQNARAKLRK